MRLLVWAVVWSPYWRTVEIRLDKSLNNRSWLHYSIHLEKEIGMKVYWGPFHLHFSWNPGIMLTPGEEGKQSYSPTEGKGLGQEERGCPPQLGSEKKLFMHQLSLTHSHSVGTGYLDWRNGTSCLASTSVRSYFTIRAVRSDILWKIKLFFFCSESYQPEELVRTPTLIVLNSNEICCAQEKGKL